MSPLPLPARKRKNIIINIISSLRYARGRHSGGCSITSPLPILELLKKRETAKKNHTKKNVIITLSMGGYNARVKFLHRHKSWQKTTPQLKKKLILKES